MITDRYVLPHTKISREVREEDLLLVKEEALIMYELCHTRIGRYNGGEAIAHCQINAVDPLRFFVKSSGLVWINPKILTHTQALVSSKEGCLSFPDKPEVTVQRWNKCKVSFWGFSIREDFTMQYKEYILNISGKPSFIVQHEIDHMDGVYIYDKAESWG